MSAQDEEVAMLFRQARSGAGLALKSMAAQYTLQQLVHMETTTGATILHHTAWSGHAKTADVVMELLKAHAPTADGTLFFNAHNDTYGIAYKAETDNKRLVGGQTPLHFAAARFNDENGLAFVRFLLDKGARVWVHDQLGRTPLHMCASADTQAVLLAAGARVHAVDHEGLTPLHAACAMQHVKTVEHLPRLVRALLAAGAHAWVKDGAGLTPLHHVLASRCPAGMAASHEDAVAALLDDKGDATPADGETFPVAVTMAAYTQEVDMSALGGKSLAVGGSEFLFVTKTDETGGWTFCVRPCSHIEGWVPTSYLTVYPPRDADIDTNAVTRDAALSEVKDAEGALPLAMACARGWARAVARLCEGASAATINAADAQGRTALHRACAASEQSGACVRTLLAAKADVTALDEAQRTPLHVAALCGNADAVAQLLAAGGVPVDSKDAAGDVPLACALMPHPSGAHKAAEAVASVVRTLLEHKADCDARSSTGMSPLLWACEHSDMPLVAQLFDLDATVFTKNKSKQTPLHLAAGHGALDMIELLVKEGADISACDVDDKTPLHMAAAAGNAPVVEYLVKKYANPIAQDADGNTPLHDACHSAHLDVATFLLGKGAKANNMNKLGQSPIHKAAEGGQLSIVKLLVEHDASLKIQDKNGHYPLHLACLNARKDVMLYLIESESHIFVNVQDNNARTPLALALSAEPSPQSDDIIEELIRHKASLDVKNDAGESVLHWAARRGKALILAMLVDERGFDVNAATPSGESPLLLATQALHHDAATLLLERGADVNAVDAVGTTPLHVACSVDGGLALARLLIEFGADVNVADENGNAPLHVASVKGDSELVELLMAHRADTHARNASNHTPMFVAAAAGHWESKVIEQIVTKRKQEQ